MLAGKILQRGAVAEVDNVLIDSRRVGIRHNTAFFALKGERHNGHNYIETLYKRGIQLFVVSEKPDLEILPEASIILVDDTKIALQCFARAHRKKFTIPVIGITGSNAKTIVKEWIYDALYRDFKIVRSPKSYNSQVGVPLSVLNLSRENNLAIFEAGISHPGEMEILEKIISPTIGIFTNIGSAHQENFQDYRQKAEEKSILFKHSDVVIFCRDHELVHEILSSRYPKEKLLSWSCEGNSADIEITRNQAEYTIQYQGDSFMVELPGNTRVDEENACHVLSLLCYLKIRPDRIKERLSRLRPIAMRLEKLDGINGCTLINDSYNSDINSLEIALDALLNQKSNKKNTLILSDILESGMPAERLYEEVKKTLVSHGVQRIIGIGDDISASDLNDSFPESEFYSTTEEFLSNFKAENFQKENILLKGARVFEFERIAELLQEQSHETVLEVNLNAMAENLNFIRSRLNPGVKIMAMVKAFAYGSGSYDVARFLEYNGVEYLSVAYTDEGVHLRQAGISLPIMVLNPETSGYQAMIRNNLEPQIYSFRTLKAFNDALLKFEFGEGYPVHIMVNTGMNRLGFEADEIDELIEYLIEKDHIKTVSVFSHLAGSDEESFDRYTACQIELFDSILEKFRDKGFSPMGHILNSNGILRHNQAQYDMVRLGLGLYGLTTHPDYQKYLHPVSSLRTSISQIRTVKKGLGVGYNPKIKLERDSRIATIPIGYADGLHRSLGNGKGKVIIKGKALPFVGSICMDMSMVDVTDIPCEEGDPVEIFGKNQSIYTMARYLETIPYEVLTNVSERVKRIFIQE
jgi:alanine racemase